MRTHVLSSSRFARQLLHSAGFADVQCSAHVTALPGFSQDLPGGTFFDLHQQHTEGNLWLDAVPPRSVTEHGIGTFGDISLQVMWYW